MHSSFYTSNLADPDEESGLAVDVAPLETMAGELPTTCPVSHSCILCLGISIASVVLVEGF